MGRKNKSGEYSDDSDDNTDSDEIEKKKKHKKSSKKHKKHKSKKKRRSSSSESSKSEQDEWIEKKTDEKDSPPKQRDDWMSAESFHLPTFSREKKVDTKVVEKPKFEVYDPATSSRELNPYFKTGEGGMPSFQRPKEDDDDDYHGYRRRKSPPRMSDYSRSSGGNWRKSQREENEMSRKRKSPSRSRSRSRSKSPIIQRQMLPAKPEIQEPLTDHSDFLTDQQMNEIGAKMIKAELTGNAKLAEKLKLKLERAKLFKTTSSSTPRQKESVVLSVITPAGTSRPIKDDGDRNQRKDDRKKKTKRVETHVSGERMQYYPDDGKYDIKQMFERERFVDGKDQDIEFAKAFSKVKSSDQMDMADIFSDHIRKDKPKKTDERDEAIREHNKMEKILDSCNKCFDSQKMDKDLVVYVGKKIYLSIPYYEGLVKHHLIISPIQHVSCSTMVDEDIWEEITNLKKSLNQFFFRQKEDVVCFETVKYLNRRPHMEIHLVASSEFEMIEFYFKKAIQECEKGTLNKRLVVIKGDKNIRQSVPRGLPYFWVDFGNSGMAHVIEDQEIFPSNFAQEIIGGMLNLDVNRWRKPRKEQNPKRRVDFYNSMLKSVFKAL